MIETFRKKPIVIEAVQLLDDLGCHIAVVDWIRENGGQARIPMESCIYIQTLEGEMRADLGDWVIRGVKGEFYPCKPDIFVATYEPAVPSETGSDRAEKEN